MKLFKRKTKKKMSNNQKMKMKSSHQITLYIQKKNQVHFGIYNNSNNKNETFIRRLSAQSKISFLQSSSSNTNLQSQKAFFEMEILSCSNFRPITETFTDDFCSIEASTPKFDLLRPHPGSVRFWSVQEDHC